jgi:hypothetical protein
VLTNRTVLPRSFTSTADQPRGTRKLSPGMALGMTSEAVKLCDSGLLTFSREPGRPVRAMITSRSVRRAAVVVLMGVGSLAKLTLTATGR